MKAYTTGWKIFFNRPCDACFRLKIFVFFYFPCIEISIKFKLIKYFSFDIKGEHGIRNFIKLKISLTGYYEALFICTVAILYILYTFSLHIV